MAILGGKKKLSKYLNAALRAKAKGKDYIKTVEAAILSASVDLSEEDRKALSALNFIRAEYLWENGEKARALNELLELFDQEYVEEDWTARVADWIRNEKITDIKYRGLLEKRLEIAPEDRRANLVLAKMIAELPSPTEADIDVVARAVKEFPLWKGGSSVLAIRYLENERTDAEALDVYKFAYPHNKDNEKLIGFLTKALIENQDKSEFALRFYRDRLDAGVDVPEALGMLCESYLEQGDISPTTWPFIVDALGRGMLSPKGVKHVSDFILTQQKTYFDRIKLAEEVYAKGYNGSELVQYLADEYASELNVNEKTIPVFADAFKAHALSKKSIRVLADHYLHAGDKGEFAARVYETYLSMVPELPQRKLYEYLAQNYISLGRTDEQARKIYEEALKSDPDNPDIIMMLAQTYLSYGVTSAKAVEIYRRAYSEATDRGIRASIALVLAEHNVRIKRFDEETLSYIDELKGAYPAPLEKLFDEALGYCYMNLARKDEKARKHYEKMFRASKNPPAKLIGILASIAIDEHIRGKPYSEDDIELFKRVFEFERFSCDPEIGFALVESYLVKTRENGKVIQPAVRAFEADIPRLVDLFAKYDASELFVEIGDFYAARFNFEMASISYREAVKHTGLDASRYRLAKMLINEGDAEGALKILIDLKKPDKKSEAQILYWEGVCHLVLANHEEAMTCFEKIQKDPLLAEYVPKYLIELRIGQAFELAGEWEKARMSYRSVMSTDEAVNFHRWGDIEIALLYLKEKRYKDALKQSEELYNKNRTGRAESRYFAMALLYNGAEALSEQDIANATSYLTQAVQVDMGDRLLRDVITDLLLVEGEKAFFTKDYDLSRKYFETSLAILPKRIDTRTFLAYSYHELRDYDQALIQYTNVPWDQVPVFLQRSQAYAYFSSRRFDKAWKVFLDLLRRDEFNKSDMPLLLSSYLADQSWAGGVVFEDIEFPDDSIDFAHLYVHDGQYKRALTLLKKLRKQKKYKDDLSILWFMGLANARLGNREMAAHYWREILSRANRPDVDKSRRMQEYLEVGLAFLDAGYTNEAMETWDALSKLDPEYEHLYKLYSETLSLNAYQLVRKSDKIKTAINEWKKALKYDPRNPQLVQNLAIAYWQIDDFKNSTRFWNRMIDWWKKALNKKPKAYAVFGVYISEIQRVLTDLITSKGKAEYDLLKIKTEDVIDYYQKANRFYWLLNLDKRSSVDDVERSYFRLLKIFNPERHPETFMLLEEAYANLTETVKKEKIDLFAYNPLDLDYLRETVWGGMKHQNIFETLRAKVIPPVPRHGWLKPSGLTRESVMERMSDRLEINLKLPDWNLV